MLAPCRSVAGLFLKSVAPRHKTIKPEWQHFASPIATNFYHYFRPRWMSSSGGGGGDGSSDDGKDDEIDRSLYTEKVPVRMPEISDFDCKIVEWHKQPGDIIRREDILCDIETPDFTFGMETDDEHLAIMGEIHVEAPSDAVPHHTVICTLLHPSSGEKEESEVKE